MGRSFSGVNIRCDTSYRIKVMQSLSGYLLQEISGALSLRAAEPTTFKEFKDALPWALVNNLALR